MSGPDCRAVARNKASTDEPDVSGGFEDGVITVLTALLEKRDGGKSPVVAHQFA